LAPPEASRVNPGDTLKSPAHGIATPLPQIEAQRTIVNDACQRAKEQLLKAAVDGRLAGAYKNVEPPVKTATGPTTNFACQQAKEAMLQALSNGLLAGACTKTISQPGEPASASYACRQAKEAMLKAATDGRLKVACNTAAPQAPVISPKAAIGDACQQAKAAMLKAAVDGRLGSAFGESVPSACQLAKDAMLKAVADGRLGDACAANMGVACQVAKEAMLRAASDGSLALACKKAAPPIEPEQPVDFACQQAKKALLKASLDGRLANACSKSAADACRAAGANGDASSLGLSKDQRMLALAMIKQAANNGSLNKALGDATQSSTPPSPQQAVLPVAGYYQANMIQAAKAESTARQLFPSAKGSPVEKVPTAEPRRCNTAERLFDKIDYKGDGIIDRDEIEHAVRTNIINKPPGFIMSDEAVEKQKSFQQKPSVGTWCAAAASKRSRVALKSAQVVQIAPEAKPSAPLPAAAGGHAKSVAKGSSPLVKPPPVAAMAPSASAPSLLGSEASKAALFGSPSKLRLDPAIGGGSPSKMRLEGLSGTPLSDRQRSNSFSGLPLISPLRGTGAAAGFGSESARPFQAEHFRSENDSLRRENTRLRKLREAGDAASFLCSQNDQLRSELGKLLTLHKREGAGSLVRTGASIGRY
jgi:hypothetical protein